jgi:peptide/nickel transport system substrate-binding protein
MMLNLRAVVPTSALLIAISISGTAPAQKQGGILRIYNPESIASLSMLEEFANAELPIMGMFNNLVMFDQHVAQNSLQSIVPDLATSWSWDEEGTGLTFQLRGGASNGTTASRLLPGTSNAPGISIWKQVPKGCASTRANRAITTSRQ